MKLPNTEIDESELSKVAKKYDLKELYIFGSVLTEKFNDSSDVDFMITYNGNPIGLFELFNLKEELKAVVRREIDLVEKDGLRNPYRRHNILSSAKLIYAA